jgi:hypothetical protein
VRCLFNSSLLRQTRCSYSERRKEVKNLEEDHCNYSSPRSCYGFRFCRLPEEPGNPDDCTAISSNFDRDVNSDHHCTCSNARDEVDVLKGFTIRALRLLFCRRALMHSVLVCVPAVVASWNCYRLRLHWRRNYFIMLLCPKSK